MQNDEGSFTTTTFNETVEPKVLSSAHEHQYYCEAYFGLWVLVSTFFMAAVVPMFYID